MVVVAMWLLWEGWDVTFLYNYLQNAYCSIEIPTTMVPIRNRDQQHAARSSFMTLSNIHVHCNTGVSTHHALVID